MKTYDRVCVWCGKDFQAVRVHALCCSKLCSTHYGQKVKQMGQKSPYEKIVDKKPKPKYRSPINDEQQQKLNTEIRNKTALKLETKTYKPGTKEWDEVVKQITPLHLIKQSAPKAENLSQYGVY